MESLASIWWAPACGDHTLRRAGSGFLPPQPGLPQDYWDQPENLRAILAYLRQDPFGELPQLEWHRARPAGVDDLLGVHDRAYVDTTLASKDASAVSAALHAAGAAKAAVLDVLDGRAQASYALVAPAGHHAGVAGRGRPGTVEFCSGAIAASIALHHPDVSRVAIIDVDVHHGNGAQEIFLASPDVLTISIHGWRNWAPGTGGQDVVGQGEGRGRNINVPLPWGVGGPTYDAVVADVVVPALDAFAPNLIVIAAGYDAAFTDPSGRMALCSRDFHHMGQVLRAWSDSHDCRGIVLTHEGGYAASYLPILTAAFINGISGQARPSDPFLSHWGEDFAPPVSRDALEVIDRARSSVDLLRTFPT